MSHESSLNIPPFHDVVLIMHHYPLNTIGLGTLIAKILDHDEVHQNSYLHNTSTHSSLENSEANSYLELEPPKHLHTKKWSNKSLWKKN